MNDMVRYLFSSALLIGAIGFMHVGVAQSGQVDVVGMTGDKEAVWIATSDNQLIYCWWPQDPRRLDKQASCRVLNQFRVDRLQ